MIVVNGKRNLTELRRRMDATKWSDRETVSDESQGVQLAMIQELARYWATDYDWRTVGFVETPPSPIGQLEDGM